MNPEPKNVLDPSEFPFERVGITGATGTVGRQLVKVLLAQCPHVRAIHAPCRPRAGGAPPRLPASPRLHAPAGELMDPGALARLVGETQIVYHLAAWLANVALPPLTDVFILNSLIPGILARLGADARKPVVFTSSHSVYFAGDYRGRIDEDSFVFRRDFAGWMDAVREPYGDLIDALAAGRRPFADAARAVDAIHARHPPPLAPKIYDRDDYHVYCLTKLLAERLVLERGGVVLRLCNVYGPGDESAQAVGEACRRILAADPDVETKVNQPFKKLVPAYLGDIVRCLVRASTWPRAAGVTPVFTVASQEHYLREDALLRAVSAGLNRIRGTDRAHRVERLPDEAAPAFSYELARMRGQLLPGETLMPFEDGVRAQLRWLMDRAAGRPPGDADLSIAFARPLTAGRSGGSGTSRRG